jgi:CRP/FNR family transcriptional regulator, cyclic AMP receptor protein
MSIPLERSGFVAALPAPERTRLLDRAVARRLNRGEHLYLAGDVEGRVHLIVSGIFKLSMCDAEGRESTLALALPGDITGEVACCDDSPQPFDVVALTPSSVVGVDGELFKDVATTNPAAALELARVLSARLRWIAATAGERTTNDVPGRLAARLLDLAELRGRMRSGTIELDLPLTQRDVGELAGMCRESASKTLTRWTREGLLEHKGRTLRIYRPDVLERIRCEGRAAIPSRSTGAAGRERSLSRPGS